MSRLLQIWLIVPVTKIMYQPAVIAKTKMATFHSANIKLLPRLSLAVVCSAKKAITVSMSVLTEVSGEMSVVVEQEEPQARLWHRITIHLSYIADDLSA